MTTRGTTLQNFSWLVVERGFRAGVSALVISYVARTLGPEEFGALNYALLLLSISIPLATFCFDAVVVSKLVQSPAEEGNLFGSALAFRFVAGAGASLLLCATAPFLGTTPPWPALSAVVAMLILQSAELPEQWFQRHLLARWTAVARIAAVAVGSAVKLELARRGAGAPALVWAQAVENGAYVLALAVSYRAAGGRFSTWRLHLPTLRHLATVAWPLGAAGLLVAVYLRLDQLFVQFVLPPATAGAYFAAARLLDVATLAIAAVGTSVFPALAAAHAGNSPDFPARLQSVFDLLSGLGWIVAIGLTLTAPWVVEWLFGAAFRDAAPIVIVKAWTGVLLYSGIARGQFVVLRGATRANLTAVLVGLTAQSAAAWWLLPLLGGVGAALAAGGAAMVSGWLTSYVLAPLRPCAGPQTRGLLIPFRPRCWAGCLALLK